MLARDAVMMNFGPKSKTCGRQNSAIHFLNSPNPTPYILSVKLVDLSSGRDKTGCDCHPNHFHVPLCVGHRILRVDASGDMLTEPLPGEQEVIQRLSELLGKVRHSVYFFKFKSSCFSVQKKPDESMQSAMYCMLTARVARVFVWGQLIYSKKLSKKRSSSV